MSLLDDMAADMSAVFFDSDSGFAAPAIYDNGEFKLPDINVVVNTGVLIELENGNVIENAITIEVLNADVGEVSRGHIVTVNPQSPAKRQSYVVGEPIKDDGYATTLYVRKQ